MTRRIRALTGVVIMSALLVLYFWFVLLRAIALLQTATPISLAMGIALIVLPLIGFWALTREITFGWSSTRLVDRLEAEGLVPEEEVPLLPSGRPERDAADALFPKYKEEVEANEGSWQSWLRLGIIYDACGDRKRARAAIRRAISLEKSSTS